MSTQSRHPAVLDLTFVLGDRQAHAYATWSWRVMSGARVRRRRRYAKLALGTADLRWEADHDQVLLLLRALGDAIDAADRAKPPAPPGGGVTGGEQLSLFDDLQAG